MQNIVSMSKLGVGLTTLLVLSAAPITLQAGTVLDQQNVIPESNSVEFYAISRSLIERAQTFTVGVTGVLTRISLEVAISTPTTAPLLINLMHTASGVPDPSNVAASLSVVATIFPDRLPDFSAFFTLTDIELGTSAFAVTAGEVLAIALSAPQAQIDDDYTWTTADNNPYSQGSSFTRSLPAGSFEMERDPFDDSLPAATDNGFRTFVETASDTNPVPEPSTFILSTILFGMFAVVWSYKRLKQTTTA